VATGLMHEIYVNGEWIDISGDIMQGTQTRVSRGAGGGKSLSTTGHCGFILGDFSGDYELRNPAGPYYGLIGRSIPHRVSVNTPESHLFLPGAGYASTPDDASFAVTDIDARIEFTHHDNHIHGQLCGQYPAGAGDRSWALYAYYGRLYFAYSTTGSDLDSVVSVDAHDPYEGIRHALRVTVDTDNGAGGFTVTFYSSNSIDGSWELIGEPVVTSGTISLHNSSSPVTVGDVVDPTRFHGKIYAFQLMDSIGGSPVTSPDFTDQDDGATSFDDAQGNTWTAQTGAEIRKRAYLWWGELRDLPHSQDDSGNYVVVSATSYDIASRSLTSAGYEQSPYRQAGSAAEPPFSSLVEYWPLEDEDGATEFSSGLPGGAPLLPRGTPNPAANADFACSKPMLEFTSGSSIYGTIRTAPDGEVFARMLVSIPSGGVSGITRLIRLKTTGSATAWELRIDASGNMQLYVLDQNDVLIYSSSWISFGLNGSPGRVGLSLAQDGGDVDYSMSVNRPGEVITSSSGTITSRTLGHALSVNFATDGGLNGVGLGHATIQSEAVSPYEADDVLASWSGPFASHERAGTRLERLTNDEDVPYYIIGASRLTCRMGKQAVANFGTLARDTAETDLGILYSSVDERAITYRTRRSMTAQPARMTLSYSGNDLSDWTPVDDSELLVNRLELTRVDGTTRVGEITSGPLSTLAPEDGGAGRSPDSARINVELDRDLSDQLGWRLSLGTADAPRAPSLPIELSRSVFTEADLAIALSVDIGDRVDVTGLPVARNPDDVQFLVVGIDHEVDRFMHRVIFRCWPYVPHRVGVYDSAAQGDYTRYSGEGTTLAEDLDTTETGVDITSTEDIEWTHDDGDYAVTVNGERMTVTGISGTRPNYTLTVVRSVNGVVRTHSSGDSIDIAEPHYYGI
jgi:hypothetical protein